MKEMKIMTFEGEVLFQAELKSARYWLLYDPRNSQKLIQRGPSIAKRFLGK